MTNYYAKYLKYKKKYLEHKKFITGGMDRNAFTTTPVEESLIPLETLNLKSPASVPPNNMTKPRRFAAPLKDRMKRVEVNTDIESMFEQSFSAPPPSRLAPKFTSEVPVRKDTGDMKRVEVNTDIESSAPVPKPSKDSPQNEHKSFNKRTAEQALTSMKPNFDSTSMQPNYESEGDDDGDDQGEGQSLLDKDTNSRTSSSMPFAKRKK